MGVALSIPVGLMCTYKSCAGNKRLVCCLVKRWWACCSLPVATTHMRQWVVHSHCFNDSFSYFCLPGDILILKVLSQQQEKLVKLRAFNNVQSLATKRSERLQRGCKDDVKLCQPDHLQWWILPNGFEAFPPRMAPSPMETPMGLQWQHQENIIWVFAPFHTLTTFC